MNPNQLPSTQPPKTPRHVLIVLALIAGLFALVTLVVTLALAAYFFAGQPSA